MGSWNQFIHATHLLPPAMSGARPWVALWTPFLPSLQNLDYAPHCITQNSPAQVLLYAEY